MKLSEIKRTSINLYNQGFRVGLPFGLIFAILLKEAKAREGVGLEKIDLKSQKA